MPPEIQTGPLPAAMAKEAEAPETGSVHHRAKGLLAIGLFKLGKAAFFVLLGSAALHLVHVNLGDLTLRAASFLRLDTVGGLVSMLQDKADLVSGHQLRQVSLASMLYACVSLVEGIGLLLEKTWAEYLTLVLTACALPLEVFEICRKPSLPKVGVLVANLLVLAYLVWFVRKARREAAAHC